VVFVASTMHIKKPLFWILAEQIRQCNPLMSLVISSTATAGLPSYSLECHQVKTCAEAEP
ncbi:MAG: hypothetical protein POH28_14625, partial [Acidocella sp.]|nr:hypothetical protein [Acidocella sp.]